MKPLGHKNYGSIGHLPGSKTGDGDYTVHDGQARIATEGVKGRKDRVIVTEKLDGSNVGIAKIDGQILALGRSGYLATSSPYEQHQLFAHWVRERWALFDELLDDGERIVGEWLALAHGTRYEVDDDTVFAAFDLMRVHQRATFDEFWTRIRPRLSTVPILHRYEPIAVQDGLDLLSVYGHHNALAPVEGMVYRVETDGKFNFLAKYVRPEFETGRYLFGEGREIWNWRPS